MHRSLCILSAAVLLAAATIAAAQPNQVIPAAANTAAAPAPGRPVIFDFKDLGDCTADTGLTAQQEYCQTSASLTKPGQAHWYRFNVLEEQSALTLHFLITTQNGRVRMGLWLPGHSLEEQPSVTAETLLASSFAQELYITIPAAQLFHSPGIYTLQVMTEYGAPQYVLRADMTPATTLLADADRQAIKQVVKDCCTDLNGLVCNRLNIGIDAQDIDSDLCHTGPIQCDRDGHITDLVLQGTNGDQDLTCPGFSAGFAQLPSLRRLDLAGAHLGADLPTIAQALAPATKLQWLVLRTANIVGQLSCDIILPSLQLLSLTRNSLTGTIPDCYTKTTTLKHLYLSDNSLSGPLPDFTSESSLELLFARDQQVEDKPSMTGGFPAGLASAGNLRYLQLSNVGLSGAIGELPAGLKYFNISANAFQGPIPSFSTELVSLDISANKFTGTLPSDMSAYANLVDIQAFSNGLEGPLPAKMPPHLVQLAVSGNKLSGPMPALPRGIKYVSVAENGLEGNLPDGPGASSIWFGDFSSNKFSGNIPTALSQAEELVYLNVSRNQLTGIASPEAWNTPAAITLDASVNAIQGTLPAVLAQQARLAYINFGSNALTGNLQAFAAAVQPDTQVGAVFDVSSNQLTGDLPEGLGNLAVFSTAPASFPSWDELDTSGYPVKVFSVADNRLSGPFPAFLTSSLTGLVAHACSDDTGSCNVWVDVDGGDNKFSCPGKTM
eukprot:GHUV01026831.1.p1 GENE.GHUV01026831.1~~GHUV01026831.1.p1  ORF type:complete len:723 (+),score=195.48 GHUV01026831.1:793-2961(+)